MMRTKLLRFGGIGVLVASSVLLGFAIVEVGLRWRFGRPLPLQDEVLDLTKLGFRYGVHSIHKDPFTIRIVGIGDSFAFGPVQPTYNYHHVIEQELRVRLRRPVEVINLGRPSIGPAAELTILRDLGLRFQPDLVLWTFFVGNDFTDDPPGVTYDLEDILGRRHWEHGLTTSTLPWYDRLRLSGYVRFLLAYQHHVELPGEDREGRITMDEIAFQWVEKQRMRLLLSDDSLSEAYVRSVKPRLQAAIRLCDDRSIPFAMAIAPDQAQVEKALARDVLLHLRTANELDPDDQDRFEESHQRGDLSPLTVAHDSLATLAQRGAIVVDLYEPFRREGAQGGLYIERHTHWNRAGNQLAADALADTLAMILRTTGRGR
ncbi:SGNH/GDSL hydrolase family protein [Candidatus Fermentibacteria bacterium]|nr:SGNH/GDSL hydrolase family protein [Candidatus Fermentibacteria bacterium]